MRARKRGGYRTPIRPAGFRSGWLPPASCAAASQKLARRQTLALVHAPETGASAVSRRRALLRQELGPAPTYELLITRVFLMSPGSFAQNKILIQARRLTTFLPGVDNTRFATGPLAWERVIDTYELSEPKVFKELCRWLETAARFVGAQHHHWVRWEVQVDPGCSSLRYLLETLRHHRPWSTSSRRKSLPLYALKHQLEDLGAGARYHASVDRPIPMVDQQRKATRVKEFKTVVAVETKRIFKEKMRAMGAASAAGRKKQREVDQTRGEPLSELELMHRRAYRKKLNKAFLAEKRRESYSAARIFVKHQKLINSTRVGNSSDVWTARSCRQFEGYTRSLLIIGARPLS